MFSPHVPSSLSSAAPRRAWHRLLVDRKHSFPGRSQIPGSLDPSGLFLHPAQSSECRPVDRKHLFRFGRRSQFPGPLASFYPFQHPVQWSDCRPVDPKHSFRSERRSQIPGPLASFGPFLQVHRAQSSRRAASRPRPQASLLSPRASVGPHGSSFQQPLSCLLVTAAPPAVGPTRLQPAPANSLLVNW